MSASGDRIAVKCPSCGKAYALRIEFAGKSAKCGCGARLRVPNAPLNTAEPELAAAKAESSIFDEFEQPAVASVPSAGLATNDYELEQPAARTATPFKSVIEYAKVAAEQKPEHRFRASESSWALKFVGVYGFVIMGQTLLTVAMLILAYLIIVMRSGKMIIETGVGLGILLGINLVVARVIYRLGAALVYGERSAVHGLLVIYVLNMAALVCLVVGWPDFWKIATVTGGVTTLMYVPPLVVAYTHWGDFQVVED